MPKHLCRSLCLLVLVSVPVWSADGQLDLSFGSGRGYVTTYFNPRSDWHVDKPWKVILQPDGKIAVAGAASDITDSNDFGVARYNPNGTLDLSFGQGGLVRQGFGLKSVEQASSMLLQPDGKLVVGGFWDATGVGFASDFALMRFRSNGSLDPTFGSGGKTRVDLGDTERVVSLARQSDGKIVAAGVSGRSPNYNFVIARFQTNGMLDATFGINGKVLTDFAGRVDYLEEIALLPNGSILAVGTSSGNLVSLDMIALARYTPAGQPDDTFGTKGKVLIGVGNGAINAKAVALLPNGRFLVGGAVQPVPHARTDFALLRFLSDGRLDTTFGDAGMVVTDFEHRWDEIESILPLKNGKIVAVGEVNQSNLFVANGAFGLARYTADGQLDQSFGLNGKVATRLADNPSYPTTAALQSDGKIIVSGWALSSDVAFGIARYQNTQRKNGEDYETVLEGIDLEEDHSH